MDKAIRCLDHQNHNIPSFLCWKTPEEMIRSFDTRGQSQKMGFDVSNVNLFRVFQKFVVQTQAKYDRIQKKSHERQ